MKKITLLFLFFCFAMQLHAQDSTETEDTTKVFTAVEQMPEFPGGMGELYKLISKNLKYPSEDLKNGVEGKVYVKFVVERDGSVTHVECAPNTESKSTLAMRMEAMRVISESPKWKPGTQAGVPVRVSFIMPLSFKLSPGGKTNRKGKKSNK